jgi:Glycosyltransferase family 87
MMPNDSPTRASLLRTAQFIVISLVGVAIIAFASRPAEKDYISYWSAGHLLLQHANPYATDAVLALEKSAGYSESRALLMRNPPWAMFLVAPLGLLSPLSGLLLWTIASLACVVLFVRLQRISADYSLLAFLFAPTLASLCAGQSSPFLLLGFALFLRYNRSRPYAAGASLLFMAIKPHLFFLFWVVLLLEFALVRERRTRGLRLFAGFTVAMAAAMGFALIFNRNLWPQYTAMLHSSALQDEFLPTISELLRMAVSLRAGWLIFLPTLLALAWSLVYFWRHRAQWDWCTHGMLLMLVAVLTSPYGWFSDQIVLLSAIAYALAMPVQRKYARESLVALNCGLLLIVILLHPPLTSVLYVWTPIVWLGWFLYAGKETHTVTPNEKQLAL